LAQKLLFLINSLEGGGAENVMVRLAGHFLASMPDDEIHLGLLDNAPDAHEVPSGLVVHRLNCRGSFLQSIVQTRKLLRTIKPNVVLSFLNRANCAAVLGRRGLDTKCVISERVNTTSHLGSGLKGRVLRRVVASLYPRADSVIAVSQGVSDELMNSYNVGADRVAVIPNPFDVDGLNALSEETPEGTLPKDFFVCVGRLVPNKGGDILLRAFAQHSNADRHIVFLGDGPESGALRNLAQALGIAERVQFMGYVRNPHAIVRHATAFVSASRSEGFPNALVEAMALGKPVAATDCPSGPSEILNETGTGQVLGTERAKWGILSQINDALSLTHALDMLNDAALRKELASKARDRAQAFSTERAMAAYERVLFAGQKGDIAP